MTAPLLLTLLVLPAAAGPPSLVDRFVAASASLLGAEYREDPLGEGPEGTVDRDPRLAPDRFDCVTLVEHSLATALAESDDGVAAVLDRIRYRQGRATFLDRHHFFVADWIPHNRWLVADVTEEIAGRAARPLVRTIDRRGFLAAHGVAAAGVENETLTVKMLPLAALAGVHGRLEHGLVVVFIGRSPGLFAAHTGILVRTGEEVTLRHASRAARRVVDEDLFRYLRRNRERLVGLLLLRVASEAAAT